MRYILYLLTLCLVFTAGMLVGNFYVPSTNTTLASAVSLPDLDPSNPALDQLSLQLAQTNLQALAQALTACPVVVEKEKEHLFNQIQLFLSLQDFKIKKAIYEAEIAKNVRETQVTSRFSTAAQNYSLAKQDTETLANTLFPLPQEEPISATENTTTQDSTSVATSIETEKKSVETIASTDTIKE